MNAHNTFFGRRFFGRYGSIYTLCALLAAPAFGQDAKDGASAPPAEDDGAQVNVTDYGTVDLAVQDTDLAQVLQMLSIQSKKNIITSKSVSATVTANLYDVTFYEALKAILEVNGYTYYEEGNFIYVITREEAEAIEKASRKTESRIFDLQHLSATDANEFVLPLLSEAGKSSFRGDVTAGFKPDVGDGGADTYAFNARLVVNDYPENLDKIAELLADLDTPPQQVLVEATVLQTSVDEANAFGIDFSVIADINFTDLTNPLSPVTNLLNGNDASNGVQPDDNKAIGTQTNVGNTSGPGGLKVGVLSDDVSVFLRVLDEVTDNTVLARPKVMALNRQRAQVLVGARVGYLSTTATETTTTQSVSFLDTGIQLVFRPFITPEGMIRMELEPKVSEASLRTVTDSNGATVTIPDELTNQLTTNVRIKDGETLILGGLFKENNRITRRQVPLLGDVPVLGAAFRGQDDKVQRSEIIFLITPTIVHDESLWENGKDTLAMVDSVTVGSRAGLLPFSRDKVTAKHNQDAMDAYNRGDSKKALYYVNHSLRLSPNQPEMIKLREKISGEKVKPHERSLMERAFKKELVPAAPSGSASASSSKKAAPMASATPEAGHAVVAVSIDSAGGIEPVMESSNEPMWLDEPVDPQSEMAAEEGSGSPEGQQSNADSMTEAEELYYENFLHQFFMSLGMLDLASNYQAYCGTSTGEDVESSFPFVTFDQVVEASDGENSMK